MTVVVEAWCETKVYESALLLPAGFRFQLV